VSSCARVSVDSRPVGPLRGVGEVGGDDDQARQQRCQGRAEEAAVGLQHAGQHHAHAVEHHLGQEDQQHARAGLDGAGAAGGVAEHQPHQEGGGEGAEQGDRHQQRDGPAQQRARGAGDLVAVAAGDGAGQHGHHQAGERARLRPPRTARWAGR
jgi:hypothetical protein